MIVGVPTEIKNHEYRVGLTPSGVHELASQGHTVVIQENCGEAIGFNNEDYQTVGAHIVSDADEVFSLADLIVKVKEPQPEEVPLLKENQILFTYLHLAANKTLTTALKNSGACCIAYETVTDNNNALPLLSPMSEVAGRISIQAAAHCLEIGHGGRGVLLGGVPGVPPSIITVLGGGVVGINAARMAAGLGADVTVVDKSLPRLQYIDEIFQGRVKTLFSNKSNIEKEISRSDAIIGAVLIPGASAPKLISSNMLNLIPNGSVLVDVAIDQGGCFESSRPTTHDNPTYIEHGVVHYCVTNMPGATARTSTHALTNATLPFVCELANKGIQATKSNQHLMKGINIYQGRVTHPCVAESLNMQYYNPAKLLNPMRLANSA